MNFDEQQQTITPKLKRSPYLSAMVGGGGPLRRSDDEDDEAVCTAQNNSRQKLRHALNNIEGSSFSLHRPKGTRAHNSGNQQHPPSQSFGQGLTASLLAPRSIHPMFSPQNSSSLPRITTAPSNSLLPPRENRRQQFDNNKRSSNNSMMSLQYYYPNPFISSSVPQLAKSYLQEASISSPSSLLNTSKTNNTMNFFQQVLMSPIDNVEGDVNSARRNDCWKEIRCDYVNQEAGGAATTDDDECRMKISSPPTTTSEEYANEVSDDNFSSTGDEEGVYSADEEEFSSSSSTSSKSKKKLFLLLQRKRRKSYCCTLPPQLVAESSDDDDKGTQPPRRVTTIGAGLAYGSDTLRTYQSKSASSSCCFLGRSL